MPKLAEANCPAQLGQIRDEMMLPRLAMTLTVLAVMVSFHGPARCDEEPQKTPAKSPEKKIPAETTNWTFDFEGYGGTPGDRSFFKVKVTHDGAVEFAKKRVGQPWGMPARSKLTMEELRRFYRAVSTILAEYDPRTSTGRVMDGWVLELKLAADTSSSSASFSGHSTVKGISASFKDLDSLLNEKFKTYDFPE